MSLPSVNADPAGSQKTRQLHAVLLWLVFIVTAVVESIVACGLGFYLIILQMAYEGCYDPNRPDTCNYAAGDVVSWGGWGAMLLVLVATGVLAWTRGRKSRSIWWLPLTAIVLIVGIFEAGARIIDAATSR